MTNVPTTPDTPPALTASEARGPTIGPLRRALLAAADETSCGMKDVTVLAVQNDPFRQDTPAMHRDGAWLANTASRLGLGRRRVHLRGLHYMLIGQPKPDGLPYTNTDKDWLWLSGTAGKAARWLGYLPFDQITDQRNAAPEVRIFSQPWPESYITVGLDVTIPDADDLIPEVYVRDFTGVQPHKIVFFGEKSSLSDVLAPLAESFQADLYLPTGEISDTLMYQMARIGAEDGRPMVVLCFSDADPAGWQMPISIGRKLQALKALGTVRVPADGYGAYGHLLPKAVEFGDLQFEVHRVALTPDQVRAYDLPSTPLKPTERRGDNWRREMQVDQTEVDALSALRPALLRQIAEQAVEPFFDASLDHRVEVARREWVSAAQAAVEQSMDPERLDRLQAEAREKLVAMRVEIAAINAAVQVGTREFELPDLIIPAARPHDPNGYRQLSEDGHGKPLLDSRWSFTDQCRALIASKAYEGGAQ